MCCGRCDRRVTGCLALALGSADRCHCMVWCPACDPMQRRLIDAASGLLRAEPASSSSCGSIRHPHVPVVLTWDAPAGLLGASLSCAADRLPRVPDLGSWARLQGCRFWAVELRQQTVTPRTASAIRRLCEPPTAESARHSGTHLVPAAGSRDAAVLKRRGRRDEAPVRRLGRPMRQQLCMHRRLGRPWAMPAAGPVRILPCG